MIENEHKVAYCVDRECSVSTFIGCATVNVEDRKDTRIRFNERKGEITRVM